MSRTTTLAAAATAIIGVASLPSVSNAEPIVALTNFGELLTFDSNVRAVTSRATVSGLMANETLRSIDMRPADGLLYGLSNQNRLYTVNPATGLSSLVGGPTVTNFNATAGTSIDFNPVVDRVRVVTRGALNGRINPNNGLQVDGDPGTDGVQPDGNLNYASGDPGFGTTPAAVGTAYTNSRPGATSTVQYTIDAARDFLTIQSPPNAGTLTTVGTQGLGFDLGATSGFVGFDISPLDNTAFLVATAIVGFGIAPDPVSNALYTVDLTTGVASLQGPIAGVQTTSNNIRIASIAVVPEPATAGVLLGAGLIALRRRNR